MIQDSSQSKCKKSLCAFPYYCTAWWLETETKKDEYIHSPKMLTSIFKILQYGSWLASTVSPSTTRLQSETIRTENEQLWAFEGLLMTYLQINTITNRLLWSQHSSCHGIYGYIKYSIIIKGVIKCLYSFLHIYSVTVHDTMCPSSLETDPRTLLGAEKKRTSAARAGIWIKK